VYLARGFRKVPIGAKAVVISLGKRTGEVRSEGWTWLPRGLSDLVVFYMRERQVDIPTAQYYTANRVKISFKTTTRITVSDPCALFDQGPGTYAPFTREGYGGTDSGAEEESVGLRRLVENSIRESVRSLHSDQVLFDGVDVNLNQRILAGLDATARRWGLRVAEVWLTDVSTDSEELQEAFESEVRQEAVGRGEMAKFEARLAKGGLFRKVAQQIVDFALEDGHQVSIEETVEFLVGFYQNERSLEVALRAAGGQDDLFNLFYMQHMGIPLPTPSPMRRGMLPGRELPHDAGETATGGVGPEGSWTVGREADILVDGDGVSRQHARLDSRGGRTILTDLGSMNGTWVDSQPIAANTPVELAPNSTVHFGQHTSFSAAQLLDMATRSQR
jgi:hypothetical protein